VKETHGAFCSKDSHKTERYKDDHAQRMCISLAIKLITIASVIRTNVLQKFLSLAHTLLSEPVVSFPLFYYYYYYLLFIYLLLLLSGKCRR